MGNTLFSIFATGLLALGLIGLLRYLTGKEQEQQTIHNRQLAEQARLLDLSGEAIMVRDAADRVLYWNQGAVDLYGYSREAALGRITHELLRTECEETLEKIRERLERCGKWEGELRHSTAAGDRIITLSSWTLDRDDTGGIRAILEANNDITARKAAELSLQRSNGQLAELTAQL